MSDAAAEAAPLSEDDNPTKNDSLKSAAKSGGSTKAALLFIGGIVALSGAVGYAKWSAEHPVRKTPSSSSLGNKKSPTAAAAEDKASKKPSGGSSVPTTPSSSSKTEEKKKKVRTKQQHGGFR